MAADEEQGRMQRAMFDRESGPGAPDDVPAGRGGARGRAAARGRTAPPARGAEQEREPPSRTAARPVRPVPAGTGRDSGPVECMERLGASAVRLAWAAAVLGAEAAPSLAADVAALGPREAAEARARLAAARVLTGGEEGRPLRFSHPLTATAVHRSIPPALRVAFHGQAAAVVAGAGRGPRAAARHLLEVHPEGDPTVVATLREAAAEYLGADAPEEARRCLERALREPPGPVERAAVLHELDRCPPPARSATTGRPRAAPARVLGRQ
ncbi:hypothetical protein IQ279_22710 [Streptomyces verrucosisporus]|uniref:hypothetical protein n=1 Tax=Streptomyces verrucosisporus TaxID=1695161 RepID=UPI0019D0E764|nr:hypothetical protein [Streptomyces verrucosisporus]MBN3932396.1 hypothetical protein [Streptomyces verrucosisporus]